MRQATLELFNSLVSRMSDELTRLALRITRDHQLAQDACQEACLELCRALRRNSDIASYEGWLRRVVTNKAIALVRTTAADPNGRAVPLNGIQEPCSRPNDPTIDPAEHLDLEDALRQLPVDHREAATLRLLRGLPCRDIASQLDCAESTVRLRVQQAVEILKGKLSDPPDGHESVTP